MIDDLVVRFVPTAIVADDLCGRTVVMIDVLRASTTIIHALANGASAVYPKAEIDASRELAKSLGPDTLLGGERGGQIIAGFDCGNSPIEYTKEKVNDKKLVLCTTNGTFTLERCRPATRLIVAAFVNLSAVCKILESHSSVLLACAGTNRMVTDEDVLFAGAVTEHLFRFNSSIRMDDSARIALSRWQTVSRELDNSRQLCEVLGESHGGRNLIRLGYDEDIRFCSQIDACSNVPELDLHNWDIRNVSASSKIESAMTSQNRR